MIGTGSLAHNRRDFIAENVDPDRVQLNICYQNENLKEVYKELFDEAVERYNVGKRKDRQITNYYEKIRQGKLVTAMPLPEETLNELKALILKRYRGRTVEFNTKVDPDIIGGGILEIGYWRIDASIAGQLKRVKKQFIEKNRRIV